MWDFELERVSEGIRKRQAKRVLVQLPEGLKPRAREVLDSIRAAGAEPVLSGDPCYGACDIQSLPEADLTVHFGHFRLLGEPEAIYVHCHSDQDVTEAVKNALAKLLGKRIGITTTVQHENEAEKAKAILESSGKTVLIAGNVLGCDFSRAFAISQNVDEFLFLGSGRFHPLGLAYYAKKRVVSADPFTLEVQEFTPEKYEKERTLRIAKASGAKSFGIIVGTKPGQKNLALAGDIARKKENAYMIAMNEITPERIDYLPFDAFVITACPRIVLDDWKNYKKPVLLPDEFA